MATYTKKGLSQNGYGRVGGWKGGRGWRGAGRGGGGVEGVEGGGGPGVGRSGGPGVGRSGGREVRVCVGEGLPPRIFSQQSTNVVRAGLSGLA